MLVVAPPHLVWQWASELSKISGKFRVHIYFGDAREKPPLNVKVLDKLSSKSAIFEDKPANNAVVVITSYQTMNSRHGPSKHASWLSRNGAGPADTSGECSSDWPANLSRVFREVILDEAHMLRNISAHASICIQWLNAPFHLLLTATPIFNSLRDVRGLQELLLPIGNDHLFNKHHKSHEFNPFAVSDEDQSAILRLAPAALEANLWNPKEPLESWQAGLCLGKVWEHLLIRRSLNSRIPFRDGQKIGDMIPPCFRRSLKLHFTQPEQEQYKVWSRQIAHRMVTKLRDGRLVWNMAKYRELALITTWLWFRYVHEDAKAGNSRQLTLWARNKSLGKRWIQKAMRIENKLLQVQDKIDRKSVV